KGRRQCPIDRLRSTPDCGVAADDGGRRLARKGAVASARASGHSRPGCDAANLRGSLNFTTRDSIQLTFARLRLTVFTSAFHPNFCIHSRGPIAMTTPRLRTAASLLLAAFSAALASAPQPGLALDKCGPTQRPNGIGQCQPCVSIITQASLTS